MEQCPVKNYDIPSLRAHKAQEWWNNDEMRQFGHMEWQDFFERHKQKEIYVYFAHRTISNTNRSLEMVRKINWKMNDWASFACHIDAYACSWLSDAFEEKIDTILFSTICFAFSRKEDLILFEMFSEFSLSGFKIIDNKIGQ